MKIVDANIVLRYLLNDAEDFSEKVEVSDSNVINEALKIYSERKLDFVDTLLYA